MTSTIVTREGLLSRIKERGYWRVIIHPTEFDERRVATLAQCWQIIESAQVNLRGYLDYPRLPHERTEGTDWIEGGGEFSDDLEVWRFYQSAQFVHYFFVSEDWLLGAWDGTTVEDKARGFASGDRTLNVYNALYTCTEVLQFAARLAYRDVLEPAARVRIELHRSRGRRLVAPRDERSLDQFVSREDTVCWQSDTMSAHLIAAAPQLAVDAAMSLFKRFGWSPSRRLLELRQQRLLEHRL